MTLLSKIRSIDETEVNGLLLSGILTTSDLLRFGQTARAREVISARSGISQTRLLRLVHRADLLRIGGVGWEFAAVLEKAGILSVASLAAQDAAELASKLEGRQSRGRGRGRAPTSVQLETWISQARELPLLIQY